VADQQETTNRTYTASVPGDGLPHILVSRVTGPVEVIITCGFGAANVEISMRENGDDSSWVALPALSLPYPKRLRANDMLFVRSDLAVRVPITMEAVG